ncbi:hypothetical protein FE257_007546 [Aspergillus nanangensis]|uniref:Uncharacterized protein n=1 Tax=Aspergillus nanangensis TaxID=2582783 RepID=A0AAD4CP46_ASPNN|nr:hypothetical protein FE257_007546 [Aspergillus nanangensis]
MVGATATVDLGGSSRRYGMTFEVSPPRTIPPGCAFPLPVIVSIRPLGDPGTIEQLVMHASLRYETGDSTAPGLTGPLTSSVRSRIGNTTSGYARFSPLRIAQPGRYRLRIILGGASASGVVTQGYLESEIISVQPNAQIQRPTQLEIMKLRSLMPENIDITAGEIQGWQRTV